MVVCYGNIFCNGGLVSIRGNEILYTMLAIYFSGTGNTKHIAELFSQKMGANCLSIEADANFQTEIKAHDTIVFCYPIYGSRVPRIMREFVAKHMRELTGKKLVILVTQLLFSGDGARVFTDMFRAGTIEVIYAEHFNMPNNICNTPLLRQPGKKKIQKYLDKAEAKMTQTCQNIKDGIVVKRGFSGFSQMLGNVQGRIWQGDSRENRGNKNASKSALELKVKSGVKIVKDCTLCGLCVSICPMKNLEVIKNTITQKNNCTVCYRCVNLCPHKAITVAMFHVKPKWQYQGVNYKAEVRTEGA